MKKKQKRWHNIKVRGENIIKHLLCHNSLTITVVEDYVESDIGKGRPMMEYKKQVMICHIDKIV